MIYRITIRVAVRQNSDTVEGTHATSLLHATTVNSSRSGHVRSGSIRAFFWSETCTKRLIGPIAR